MVKGKEIVLPKLPRGMGSYSWNDDSHTLIKYRKVINYMNEKKTIPELFTVIDFQKKSAPTCFYHDISEEKLKPLSTKGHKIPLGY